MPERGDKPPGQRARSSRSSAATPAPPARLAVTLTTLEKGQVLHRVHQDRYDAGQFNPGKQGNARFSPIQNDQGQPIPALYGGTTLDCALMETIFHDVPHTAGFKSLDKGKLAGQMHSILEVMQPLQLVDLSNIALRKLGITRKQLIDTEKDQYPATRQWAAAIHHQCQQAQGLIWVSRQDDTSRAVMLFGDRIPKGALRPQGQPRSLTEDGNTYDASLDLADRIGVVIIPGKS